MSADETDRIERAARAAFDTWHPAQDTGTWQGDWASVPDEIRGCWQAAVRAAIDTYGGDRSGPHCPGHGEAETFASSRYYCMAPGCDWAEPEP